MNRQVCQNILSHMVMLQHGRAMEQAGVMGLARVVIAQQGDEIKLQVMVRRG